MEIFFILLLGLVPGVAITLYIYWRDKHEREPIGLLLVSFVYGILSTLITLILSRSLHPYLIIRDNEVIDQIMNAFIRVAFIEELSKFVFIRFILYHNKNFNEPFDGIVYSIMVGMGFATLENIFYTFNYGMTTGILRMFTTVPAHGTFAVLMGYFLGKAKFSQRGAVAYGFIALVVATFFHGLYDYFWFVSYNSGLWLGALISLGVALFLSRHALRLHGQSSPFGDK